MVLPEPAAHDAPGQAVGWADEIGLSLSLSGGGAIALVDRAHPARLGDLVRTLRHLWPEIDVLVDVQEVAHLPPGSALVLAPRAEDADWLNQRRQVFAEKKLKVVLWCDEPTTVALARRAPDLYDWITHRRICPPGPAPFAVTGLRAAFEAGWPVAWRGTPGREAIEEVVRTALPAETMVWIAGADPYEALVKKMGVAAIVGVEITSVRQLRRARWAYADSKRKGRVIFATGELDCPGFWPVHDRFTGIREAREMLAKAGVKQGAGRLAALLDLEPKLLTHAVTLLANAKVPVQAVEDAALRETDPAAGLVQLLETKRKVDVEATFLLEDPPVLRSFGKRPKAKATYDEWIAHVPRPTQVKHTFEERAVGMWAARATSDLESTSFVLPSRRAWAIEPLLRRGVTLPVAWITLAMIAASLGESRVAQRWLYRVAEDQLPKGAFLALSRIEPYDDPIPSLCEAAEALEADASSRIARTDKIVRALHILALFAVFGGLLVGERTHFLSALIGGFALAAASIWASSRIAKTLSDGSDLHSAAPFIDLMDNLARWTREARKPLAEARSAFEADALEKAEPLARDALDRASTTLGEDHPTFAEATGLLAAILLARHESAEALDLLAPLLSEDRDLPGSLLVLGTRALTESGRAADAVRALTHLTRTHLPDPVTLPPSSSPPTLSEDPIVTGLLRLPEGCLDGYPQAYLTLTDALLKQGRYPEALQVARRATTTFTRSRGPTFESLRARQADLERRVGPIS
jgi:tetratricopeptide (TPR) repeat protein